MPIFQDRVAIITGAGSGIGKHLTKGLSTLGARVVLNARRKENLDRVAANCYGPAMVIPADVTLAEDRKRLVDMTMDAWGRVDFLFNNAGLGYYGEFLESDETQWRRLFELNLFAPVELTRMVLPIMLDQNSGTIVNVGSIAGLMAHSDKVSPYVSSKHALIGFTRGLAKDLDGSAVRILAACPHLTDTDFFSSSPGADAMAPLIEKYKSYMDTPADVAQGILDQLDSQGPIIFPTEKPANAYARQRDI